MKTKMTSTTYCRLAKMGCIPMVAALPLTLSLAACSFADPYVQWKEEVKINDGRVIVVDDKKRIGGALARETWLTIAIPEISATPVLWHENLRPLIVNVDAGKLYVVGYPHADGLHNKSGKQEHCYLGFVWQANRWIQIPFEEIPKSIYTTNMLVDDFPPKGTELLTLEKKNSRELNGDPLIPYDLRKLDPKVLCSY